MALHVAIIMDGNGRWALERKKSRLAGHFHGAKTLKNIIKAACSLNIDYLTFYAFSLENHKRPEKEVNFLMRLFKQYLKHYTKEIHEKGVCLRFIGDRSLPQGIIDLMDEKQALTALNTGLKVQIAFNYGGRQEILHAVRTLSTQVQEGFLCPEDIDQACFSKALWTNSWPDPDILIRTGGENRLSNFLLWQLHYAELFFRSEFWPDFKPDHLQEILQAFQKRHRRFGSV